MSKAPVKRRRYHHRLKQHFAKPIDQRPDFFSLSLAALPGSTIDYYIYHSTEDQICAKGFKPPLDDTKKMGSYYAFKEGDMRILLQNVRATLLAQGAQFTYDDVFINTALSQTLDALRRSISKNTQ